MKRILAGILLLITLPCGVRGQITFRNATSSLPGWGFRGLWTKGVADLNGDGYDDIVRTRFPSGDLFVVYQTQNGVFRSDSITRFNLGLPLSTTIGDLNKDKRNDIITGGNNNGLFIQYNLGNAFSQERITEPLVLMQAANLVDINNDGWLDYFACNDTGLNQLWKNTATGHLQAVSNWIDFRTVPTSDNSGNYGSVWSDIDNDGDLDLYIAKCSEWAMNDPADPRRINQLFINHTYDRIGGRIVKNAGNFSLDPTGWFTEEAASYNVKISGQSWSADFADIDNDGDQDLLVTNHEAPTMLLENDGTGHFTDITAAGGLEGLGKPLQGIIRDFDNDGYVDILIAGSTQRQLWLNNKNKTFRPLPTPFDSKNMQSFAVGDLNRDGFYDVYASYAPNASIADDLWLNSGNSNHFLGITLQGEGSNTNGVGAKITLYRQDGSSQVREIRAGESYGITNTYTQYFGLGQNTTNLSRIEVQWPSGHSTVYNSPPPDQFLYLTEGGCMLTDITQQCSCSGLCPIVTTKIISKP